MTSRERWIAALTLQQVDRLPFWPKLSGSYPPGQNPPFRDMDLTEIHRWIGSDRHEHVPSVVTEKRTRTAAKQERDSSRLITEFTTPHGVLRQTQEWDAHSQSWHPVEFPVKTPEDIKILRSYFADCQPELNRDAKVQAETRVREVGEDAVTAMGIGESPLMSWVEWFAGIENAHFFLNDYQDEVEALFAEMHRVLLRSAEIIAEHQPGDMLYMVENTSTTLISPQQYSDYCFGHIMDYANAAVAHGRHMVLHMCGHLKVLLPQLAKLPVAAFEAFTAPTLGNTTLLDGRTACPDKCLIGGTSAIQWLKPAEAIISEIQQDLDALPHHRGIVVTSAGVMPPLCKPETIRQVCDWIKTYPVRQ